MMMMSECMEAGMRHLVMGDSRGKSRGLTRAARQLGRFDKFLGIRTMRLLLILPSFHILVRSVAAAGFTSRVQRNTHRFAEATRFLTSTLEAQYEPVEVRHSKLPLLQSQVPATQWRLLYLRDMRPRDHHTSAHQSDRVQTRNRDARGCDRHIFELTCFYSRQTAKHRMNGCPASRPCAFKEQ